MMMLPLVRDTASLQVSSTNPLACQTAVQTASGPLWICPPVVAAAGEKQFVPPFWAMRRSEIESETNMRIGELTVKSFTKISSTAALPKVNTTGAEREEKLPIAYNISAIDEGCECVLLYRRPAPAAKKTEKSKTWKDFITKPPPEKKHKGA